MASCDWRATPRALYGPRHRCPSRRARPLRPCECRSSPESRSTLLALPLARRVATAAACAPRRRATPPRRAWLRASLGSRRPPRLTTVFARPPADDASACAPVPVEAGFFGEDGSCGKFVYLPCGDSTRAPRRGLQSRAPTSAPRPARRDFFICTFPAPTCEDGGVALGRRDLPRLHAPASATSGAAPWVSLLRAARARPRAARSGGTSRSRPTWSGRRSMRSCSSTRRLKSFGPPTRLSAGRAARRGRRETPRADDRVASPAATGGPSPSGAPSAPRRPSRSRSFALENAVEGCVRETFGALVAMHQGERASDPRASRGRCAISPRTRPGTRSSLGPFTAGRRRGSRLSAQGRHSRARRRRGR